MPSDPKLHLVVVGKGTLVSDLPLGSDVGQKLNAAVEQAATYHAAKAVPILVANGVSALAAAPFTSALYRAYSWIVPLQRGDVHAWSVGSFQSRVDAGAVRARVGVRVLRARGPDRRRAGGERLEHGRRPALLLIGGEAAALLLAFALLAAASGSRRNQAAMRRLTWLGASGSQRGLVFAAEAVAIALAGTIVGWAVGAAIAAAIADAAGSPAGAVLHHSVLSWAGIAAAAGLAAAATLVLLLSLWRPRRRVGPFTITAIDVAAIGALVAVVLALVRGSADSASIAQERGTGVFLLLLPGLVAFVAAVVGVRLLPPILRLLERSTRGSVVPLRLAAVSLARNPGRSAIAVSFLIVSIGLAAFAGAYRSTLTRNQADEAAYAVPLTATLQEDFTQGVYPLEAAPLARLREARPGRHGLPGHARAGRRLRRRPAGHDGARGPGGGAHEAALARRLRSVEPRPAREPGAATAAGRHRRPAHPAGHRATRAPGPGQGRRRRDLGEHPERRGRLRPGRVRHGAERIRPAPPEARGVLTGPGGRATRPGPC